MAPHPIGRLREIFAGLTAIAVGYAFMLVVQAAQQPSIGPTENVVICADRSNVLHARAARAGCAAGEAPLTVQATHLPPTPTTDGLDLDNWPVHNDSDRPQGNTLTDLEARVARLKLDLAYFTVVDRDGSKIFEVESDVAHLYSHDAHVSVAAMSTASNNGGLLAARTADGSHVMKAGGVESKVGVQIAWDGIPRLQLGRFDTSNFALKVLRPGGGGNLAAIGESFAGTGALVVGTRGGKPRASMSVDQGRGQVSIFDDTGASVASMREAESGDGILSLGKTVEFVKMVVNGAYGAVLAGPVLGFPHVPASGIPGSYLLGCSGGPACHPR